VQEPLHLSNKQTAATLFVEDFTLSTVGSSVNVCLQFTETQVNLSLIVRLFANSIAANGYGQGRLKCRMPRRE
jgi:hypothetical protein